MFDRVAKRYDLTNTVLSGGRDVAWRRATREALDPRPGQVVLDAADLAHAPGDGDAAGTVRLVAMHELGHLVGLGHVDDPTELMHAETGGTLTGFGPGDLRGLHELGSGDCA